MQPINSPAARESYGLVYDPMIDRVILFGGLRRNTLLNDTWKLGFQR